MAVMMPIAFSVCSNVYKLGLVFTFVGKISQKAVGKVTAVFEQTLKGYILGN